MNASPGKRVNVPNCYFVTNDIRAEEMDKILSNLVVVRIPVG